jgi:hypothetical protein
MVTDVRYDMSISDIFGNDNGSEQNSPPEEPSIFGIARMLSISKGLQRRLQEGKVW